jgi:hypothetical protein
MMIYSRISERASTAGVSERTQRTAERVANASPEKIKEVARGEKTWPQVAQQHITPSNMWQIQKIVLHPPLHSCKTDTRNKNTNSFEVGVSA